VIVADIDGGSRGNPGPAGYGVRVEDEQGMLVEELRGALGVATNNAAEYHGLLVTRVGRVRFQHVRRELNKEADRLANLAMDEEQKIRRQKIEVRSQKTEARSQKEDAVR
jgi:ribonuclease HI